MGLCWWLLVLYFPPPHLLKHPLLTLLRGVQESEPLLGSADGRTAAWQQWSVLEDGNLSQVQWTRVRLGVIGARARV